MKYKKGDTVRFINPLRDKALGVIISRGVPNDVRYRNVEGKYYKVLWSDTGQFSLQLEKEICLVGGSTVG
tara:strand:- start:16 stop:225 length:210 start_codon:yes stop_codon:yes gene_type:complete